MLVKRKVVKKSLFCQPQNIEAPSLRPERLNEGTHHGLWALDHVPHDAVEAHVGVELVEVPREHVERPLRSLAPVLHGRGTPDSHEASATTPRLLVDLIMITRARGPSSRPFTTPRSPSPHDIPVPPLEFSTRAQAPTGW
jgi:hypothetical protein